MSRGIPYLHSHSGIERGLKFPKHTVIVDAVYKDLFIDPAPYPYMGKTYYMVDILDFVNKGGVFKNAHE